METTFWVKPKEAPEWAQKIIQESGKRPVSIAVHVGNEPYIPGSLCDHHRVLLFPFDGIDVGIAKGTYGGMNPWSNVLENTVNRGFQTHFRTPLQGVLRNEHVSWDLYLPIGHPMVTRRLKSGDDPTWEERVVLHATGYKNSYGGEKNVRFTEARRGTGISQEAYDKAKTSCQAKGWLDKRGAITAVGKTVRGDRYIYGWPEQEETSGYGIDGIAEVM